MGQCWNAYVMHVTYRKAKGKDGQEYVVAVAQTLALDPRNFDCGSKLMEHCYLGNDIPETIVGLLCDAYRNPPDMGIPEAAFKGFRIAWIGDYLGESDLLDHGMTKEKWTTLSGPKVAKSITGFDFSRDFYKDVLDEEGNPRFEPILVCDERKEYLNINRYRVKAIAMRFQYGRMKGHEQELIPHPLPILCAACNGKGGGDYEGTSMDEVGSWAFKHVRAVHSEGEVPGGYKDLSEHPFEEGRYCR